MNSLKSTSPSALQLVQQRNLSHIEQEQAMTQYFQVNPTQQLDLDQTVDPNFDQKDQEIEAPVHYIEGRTIQPIEVLEDWNLNHHLACALKYIARAGRKHNEVKDLKKAVWYLERRIKLLEQQE